LTENRKSLIPWILIGGGALLLLAGLAWVVLNQQEKSVVTPTPASVEQVERVPLDDAKAAFDAGTAIFLDVRAGASYEASHIPGAVSIPLNELSTRMGELDPASWIIPY
jgi:3-mercaptopyruvate sulfurtransferase SseA